MTGTTVGRRAPVLRRPGEVGLDFEEVTFPSMDGVALEGWFIPAGYNILCYDIRNHGLSRSGNGGIVGIGLLEYRDVIGSVRYAESRPDTASMTTFLLSVCLGADSATSTATTTLASTPKYRSTGSTHTPGSPPTSIKTRPRTGRSRYND